MSNGMQSSQPGTRRRQVVLLALHGIGLAACSPGGSQTQQSARIPDFSASASGGSQTYADSRKRMWQKFGDEGIELIVDAFKGQEFFGVEFFPAGSDRPFYAKSLQTLRNRSYMLLPLEIPEKVRAVWRASDSTPVMGKYGEMTYEDPIIGTDTIEVGARILQEVVDELRKNPGQLRLKFRMSNDGVYFGWDIQRLAGRGRQAVDQKVDSVHSSYATSMIGGDFREAEIYNGKAVRNGWYIHPKTGERTETDF
jgi:hypothetical protein